jgi:hypothetical protein
VFKRWRALTLLFLLVGVLNLIRAGMALYIAPAMAGWALSLPLPWLGAFYAVWGIGWMVVAVRCWRRRGRCRALAMALAYQATLWLLHLLTDRSPYVRSLWVRDLLVTGSFLALVIYLSSDDTHVDGGIA